MRDGRSEGLSSAAKEALARGGERLIGSLDQLREVEGQLPEGGALPPEAELALIREGDGLLRELARRRRGLLSRRRWRRVVRASGAVAAVVTLVVMMASLAVSMSGGGTPVGSSPAGAAPIPPQGGSTSLTPVPEPSSAALCALGAALALRRRR